MGSGRTKFWGESDMGPKSRKLLGHRFGRVPFNPNPTANLVSVDREYF